MARRGRALAGVLAGLGLLAAGCGGGSKAPSVASLATTTSSGGQSSAAGVGGTKSTKPSAAALASCFTAHGLQASVGSGAGGGNSYTFFAGVAFSGNVDPNSPQFQAAVQACRKYLPGGPPALSPAGKAEAAKAMVRFAACMRRKGVSNFPDPNGQGLFPLGTITGLDANSPLFQSAFTACRSLEPKVGPQIEFGP